MPCSQTQGKLSTAAEILFEVDRMLAERAEAAMAQENSTHESSATAQSDNPVDRDAFSAAPTREDVRSLSRQSAARLYRMHGRTPPLG